MAHYLQLKSNQTTKIGISVDKLQNFAFSTILIHMQHLLAVERWIILWDDDLQLFNILILQHCLFVEHI